MSMTRLLCWLLPMGSVLLNSCDLADRDIRLTIHQRVCDPSGNWKQETFEEACGKPSTKPAATLEIRIDRKSHIATLHIAKGKLVGPDIHQINSCVIWDSNNWRCDDVAKDGIHDSYQMIKGEYRFVEQYDSGLAPSYWTGVVERSWGFW